MTYKPHHDPTHLYFITATILQWQHLFVDPAYANIVLDSLAWHHREGRWSLYAYVLMPSHLHAIIRPLGAHTVSDVLQSFGSFTAHAILRRLRQDGRHDLLAVFAHRQDRHPKKKHQIWQPLQAKNIFSRAFLSEKLTYIHNNPLAKGWQLAEDCADYPYSSACYYERGVAPPVEVDDVREWL
jgi:putative transposase